MIQYFETKCVAVRSSYITTVTVVYLISKYWFIVFKCIPDRTSVRKFCVTRKLSKDVESKDYSRTSAKVVGPVLQNYLFKNDNIAVTSIDNCEISKHIKANPFTRDLDSFWNDT